MPHLEPTGIELSDSRGLFCVGWEGGARSEVPYRALRLACRCATCIDELTGRPLLDPATVPEDVGVQDVEQVGLYGVRIHWTDGHRTGIYTWERVRDLALV
ncbi:MAG: DUF971 domain-containing protein [Planctomycetota bacterium]